MEELQSYVNELTEYANKNNINSNMYKIVFGVDYNKTYNRVWVGELWVGKDEVSHKSAFCFVDYAGNIYKPAGWKAPAKGIRGNLNGYRPMTSGELYKDKRY